jgi:hypothetical protein
MTIETKYNIGDEVWFMADNKAHRGIIFGFRFIKQCGYIKGGQPEVVSESLDYIVSIALGHTTHMEEFELFPTKEELLKSL